MFVLTERSNLITGPRCLFVKFRCHRSRTLCFNQVSVLMSLQLPCLSSYTPYCSNQVKAKALLDQKKQDRRVQDFLQRCLQSPFSRKLDLWNFLDIPRSRLVKYPLLLREILKHTPNDHPDRQHLDEAVRKKCQNTVLVQVWLNPLSD